MWQLVVRSWRQRFIDGLLLGLTAAIFVPMLRRMATAYDYVVHLGEARRLAESGAISAPHMLFHALVAALIRLGGDPLVAVLVVLLLCVTATVLTIYYFWLKPLPLPPVIAPLLALTLVLVAPLPLLYSLDRHLYFGYLGINVFHNPTMLLLKAFALPLFFVSAALLSGRNVCRRSILLLLLPFGVVGCALAKPSFLICFLPALLLLAGLTVLRRQPLDTVLVSAGIFLPALLVLSWQYTFAYGSGQHNLVAGESGVVFAPLQVMRFYSGWLAAKLLLSILFPVAVAVSYGRSLRHNPELLLAWITFFFGAILSYGFMESGPRAYQGNFIWSGQIALFILFVASTAHLLRQRAPSVLVWGLGRRQLFCLGVLLLHFVAGIVFYAVELKAAEMRYW